MNNNTQGSNIDPVNAFYFSFDRVPEGLQTTHTYTRIDLNRGLILNIILNSSCAGDEDRQGDLDRRIRATAQLMARNRSKRQDI